MRVLITFCTLTALVACGGASTGGSSAAPSLTPIQSLRIDADRLAADVEAGGVAPIAAIPVAGSATFTGVAAFGYAPELSYGEGIGGRARLDVDFGSDSLSGSITDFYSREGEGREGAFTITNGQITRTSAGALVSADLTGTLEFLYKVRDFEGSMLAAFAGPDAANISGELTIEAPSDLGEELKDVPIIVTGGIVLER